MKVKVSLDPISYAVKPINLVKKITNRIAKYPVSIDIEDLAEKVGNRGHTFCPATFISNRRIAEDFAEMQVFALDFDCGITPEEVQERARKYELPIAFMYHSFHSSAELQKFRTIFLNDVPVTERRAAEIIILLLMEIFPEADKSCKDVSRMFFGGKNVIGRVERDTMNVEKLAEQYQRMCFIKGPQNYTRAIRNFARKNKIGCKNHCLQIFRIDKNEVNSVSHPYIYGSSYIFPSISPKYVIYESYNTCAPATEQKSERIRLDLKRLEERCQLYTDFLELPHIHHNERFLLMTNMIRIHGGDKRFLSIIEKKGYDRNDWRFYVSYAKDKNYKPQQCEGNCPYCNVCRHKANMILTIMAKIPIKRIEEEKYYELTQIETHIRDSLTDVVNSRMGGIHIIPAQTAVGKTETYCNLIASDERHKYMIAAPTNLLKHEIEKRLAKKGIHAAITPSLDEMSLPSDFAQRIESYYKVGLGRKVAGLMKEYIRENKDATDSSVMRAVYECREYLHFEESMDDFRVVVTTHARLPTFSSENIKDYIVIIDEDILSTFFKSIQTVSFGNVQKAFEAKQTPDLLHSRLRQIVDAPEGMYEQFAANSTYSYLEEHDLEVLGIHEDINDIAFAACFQRYGDTVHYFCPQMLPLGKYIVLSATAEPELYHKYFKGWNITVAPYYKAKYQGSLEQRTAYSMSRQCILDHRQELDRFLEPLKSEYQMITFMKYEEEFEASVLHFGNSEGVDFLNGKNLLILGTPHLCEFVYKLAGCFLGMEVNSDVLSVRRIQYGGYEFSFMTYKGNDLQRLQLYFIHKELEQCIGRARLLRNDCRVLVLSNFPCEQAELIQDDYLENVDVTE